MPHPNMMDNPLRRNNSMFNLATGGAGDFFDPMMNNNIPIQTPSSQGHENTNASTNGEMNNNQGMGPPPPWMGPMFPNSPGNPLFNPQQNMMNQGGLMNTMMPMGMPMFNNPMMPPQQPLWNFMNSGDMWLGNDFPLPFMNSSDPNLIASVMNGVQQPQQPRSPGENEENKNKRSGTEPENMPKQNIEMMPPPPPPPQPPAPMLRRGLSLLGGLFGGDKRSGPYYDDFNPPQMRFGGNFSEPMQGVRGRTKKEERLAQQYQKLGSFWCWRIADSDDQFQSFNISNQKIIKRKSDNVDSRGRILLGKEKTLPGDIMVDLNQGRGGCMTSTREQNSFLPLEIKLESFEGSSYVFNR